MHRLYLINHTSQNGIKKRFFLYLFYALWMDFMHFCEEAKMSAWQMFSHDQKAQNGIPVACWWMQESIA